MACHACYARPWRIKLLLSRRWRFSFDNYTFPSYLLALTANATELTPPLVRAAHPSMTHTTILSPTPPLDRIFINMNMNPAFRRTLDQADPAQRS